MPLELFDDKAFDELPISEWADKVHSSPTLARGLFKNGRHEWKDVVIHHYDENTAKFIGKWTDDESEAKLSRIHVVFNVNFSQDN